MSHFSVLVVTKDQKEETLSEALLPYHEYECTGRLEYTQWVDHTQEIEEGWAGLNEAKRVEYGYASIVDYANDYHGCNPKEVDGKLTFGRTTNPNKKWDWWTIGGRWSEELVSLGKKCDRCLASEADLESMRLERIKERNEAIDRYAERAEMTRERYVFMWNEHNARYKHWRGLWEKSDKSERLWDYFNRNISTGFYEIWTRIFGGFSGLEGDTPYATVQEWIDNAPPLLTFALLDAEGIWHQRGRMGWFACVSDENKSWEQQFPELLAKIDPSHFITVVDCSTFWRS